MSHVPAERVNCHWISTRLEELFNGVIIAKRRSK
jgi:hypothetical protein